MARDLRLSVSGDSTSGQKALDKLAAEADKAAKQVQSMAAKADAAAVKARKLAESEARAADKAGDLAAKTAALRKQIADSGVATADQAKKLDRLTRETKAAESATDDYRRAGARAAHEARQQAREYDRVAENAREAARAVARFNAVSTLTPDGKGGKGGGFGAGLVGLLPSFVGDLLGAGVKTGGAAAGAAGSAASAGGPYVTAALIGAGSLAALAAAPFIGGAIGGGALLGGAGAGAGLGLAGAWMGDPAKFSAMWSMSIDSVKKRWIDSSAQFGGPLEDSLKEVDRVLRDLPIERLADASKGFVEPLVQGAGGGITELADGFADFVEAAQPVVDTVGPELVGLGRDVGDAMRAIGLGADGGALALGDLVNAVGYVIKATGIFIMGLEKAYEAERKFVTGTYDLATAMPVTGQFVEFAAEKFTELASTTITAGRALDNMGEDADGAGEAVQGLSADLDVLRTKQLAMFDANIALAQGWLDLKEELNDGKKTLDLNTQAGIDNAKALEEQVATAERARQQQIELTGDVDAANATYAANVERIRQMAYAAGFNKQKVDELIASIAAIPPAKSTEVQVKGIGAALSNVSAMANALERIQRTYTAHLRVTSDSRSGPERRARGGTLPNSGFRIVGEHGMEAIWGSRGDYVSTAEQTRQLLSMMGGGGSGPAAGPLTMQVAPGADTLFGQMIQYALDRGWVQFFAGSTQVTTRPG